MCPPQADQLALGGLIIKEQLGTTDPETVEPIRESPYLQDFLGFHEYQDQAPFDASMLTHFRPRLSLEVLRRENASVAMSYWSPSRNLYNRAKPSQSSCLQTSTLGAVFTCSG
jgi:hypothetical protein